MSKKKSTILTVFVLLLFIIVHLFATQSYRVIPYIPFKIATCPYGEGRYVEFYHDLPGLVFPGQGSDGMLHLVVRNWWGQIEKEGIMFKYNVEDIHNPCEGREGKDLAYLENSKGGANWQRILPLWETPTVEVNPKAIIINENREVLFLHFGKGTRPDTTWPRGNLYKEGEDPEQFIVKTMPAYLPFNIISIKEAFRDDFKLDDGSISRSIDFVVLVEQKPGTTMADLPNIAPTGILATYEWHALDSEYAKNEFWHEEYEKILLTLNELLTQ